MEKDWANHTEATDIRKNGSVLLEWRTNQGNEYIQKLEEDKEKILEQFKSLNIEVVGDAIITPRVCNEELKNKAENLSDELDKINEAIKDESSGKGFLKELNVSYPDVPLEIKQIAIYDFLDNFTKNQIQNGIGEYQEVIKKKLNKHIEAGMKYGFISEDTKYWGFSVGYLWEIWMI